MKNKKGFTLIELLAVIVILAVVAIIAVPIILNVIESAKKGAIKDSAHGIIEAANVYVATNLKEGLKNNVRFTCENNKCIGTNNQEITFKGKVEHGTLIINSKSNVVVCVDDGKYYAVKLENDQDVTNGSGTCGEYEEEQGEFVISSDFDTLLEEAKELRRKMDAINQMLQEATVSYNYDYTGEYKVFKAPITGTYKIELWGAAGGGSATTDNLGAYTSGEIKLTKDEELYVYVGNKPSRSENSWNGGGEANNSYYPTDDGGGATDIRTVPTSAKNIWQEDESLRSRIMVAGAGGGEIYNSVASGAAGGLTGYNGVASPNSYSYYPIGGSQIKGGDGSRSTNRDGGFGYGGNGELTYGGGAGGSGWYGGGGGDNGLHVSSGAGGSSYISGHLGCVGINADGSNKNSTNPTLEDSYSHTGYIFTNTKMIDGKGYEWTNQKDSKKTNMPKHDGSTNGDGNQGNGYARITLISID